MNFAVYLIGYLLISIGVLYALNALGIPQPYIIAAGLVLAGLGILGAFSKSKRGDVADAKVDRMNDGPGYRA